MQTYCNNFGSGSKLTPSCKPSSVIILNSGSGIKSKSSCKSIGIIIVVVDK